MNHRRIASVVAAVLLLSCGTSCSKAPRHFDTPFEQPGTPIASRESFCSGYLTRDSATSMLGGLRSITERNRFSSAVMVGDCSLYDKDGLVLRIYGDYLLSDGGPTEAHSRDASQPGAVLGGAAVAYPAANGVFAAVALPQGGRAEIFVSRRRASPGTLRAALRTASMSPVIHLRKLREASASASPPTGTERPRRYGRARASGALGSSESAARFLQPRGPVHADR
jgi:hypothetical protein